MIIDPEVARPRCDSQYGSLGQNQNWEVATNGPLQGLPNRENRVRKGPALHRSAESSDHGVAMTVPITVRACRVLVCAGRQQMSIKLANTYAHNPLPSCAVSSTSYPRAYPVVASQLRHSHSSSPALSQSRVFLF